MQLIRIAELSRRAGVPIATIKHYLREGLIEPTRKSGKTMSWYDPTLATRIRAIKELQQRQFLPLHLIGEALDRNRDAPDDLAAAEAIAKVLARHGAARSRTRAEILERGGATPRELDLLAAAGLAVPSGPDQRYVGDDLALLSTLGAARKAGITIDMLPFAILDRYLASLRQLVQVELEMFRAGVVRKAARGDLARLSTAATELSERLVVLVRRKLLLPTLQRLIEEDDRVAQVSGSRRGASRGQRVRREPGQHRRSTRRARSR